jgi:hypothetical protein
MALPLSRRTPDLRSYGLLVVVVFAVATAAFQATASFFIPDPAPYEMDGFVNRLSARTDLILTQNGEAPAFFTLPIAGAGCRTLLHGSLAPARYGMPTVS